MTAALPRRLATPSSVNAAIKQIADVMRRANYAGALQYVPELSWILFLRILDEREALGVEFSASLEAPYRWRDWAAPGGAKRFELSEGAMGAFLPFVNSQLLPYLQGLREAVNPNARSTEDTRTPQELLDIIESKGREVDAAIATPRHLLSRADV